MLLKYLLYATSAARYVFTSGSVYRISLLTKIDCSTATAAKLGAFWLHTENNSLFFFSKYVQTYFYMEANTHVQLLAKHNTKLSSGVITSNKPKTRAHR